MLKASPLRFACAVTHRAPVKFVKLPLIGRLQRTAFRPRRRAAKRLIGKPARCIYRWARAIGMGGLGTFTLDLGGNTHAFEFDARNTQFIPVGEAAYEPELAALLDLLLDDTGIFFDVGANWGYFPLYVLSRPGFAGVVHAFEPYPPSFRDLQSIARQSPYGERLVCHAFALSDCDGCSRMGLIDGLHSGLARIGGTHDAVDIDVRRLDSLGLPQPHVVKIDVEGHESRVLEGAREVLAAARPFILFESWREPARPAVTLEPFSILARSGYEFFVPVWISDSELHPVPFAATNLPPQPSWRLGLVDIGPAHRFLLADQLNILACPGERIGELARRFGAT